MHTINNETNTIDEFKRLKAYLEQRAKEHYENHKKAFENWRFGEIDKVWIDKDGFICIQYDSGDWWPYKENGEWW
ncbi:hypothetical protein H0486_18090 [Lachnospiraceae bacterium MD1]|uniref:Uncharacterized protein n=1 Tax=Variimorphobacter saccharofermentans TaxID=2755051 RepID=A0A839K6Q6_9FIRM|nr:hypothetical protein [Variimorphobacter saccharofermentans]MBB2184769.1 hypothetical protein [Variimorphobacter saccharofermentans]